MSPPSNQPTGNSRARALMEPLPPGSDALHCAACCQPALEADGRKLLGGDPAGCRRAGNSCYQTARRRRKRQGTKRERREPEQAWKCGQAGCKGCSK
jgi:hypothetical protein